jgi:tetratricopeptide (TPR) repeat protein
LLTRPHDSIGRDAVPASHCERHSLVHRRGRMRYDRAMRVGGSWRSDEGLVALTVPSWLCETVRPWRVEEALAWPDGGIAIVLASPRARVPILIRRGDDETSMRLLDPRTAKGPGRALVHAVRDRLRDASGLLGWLSHVEDLRRAFSGTSRQASVEVGAIRALWAAWPERVSDPARQVAALPPVPSGLQLDRAARAALVHHRIARGETLRALDSWSALGLLPRDAGFVELHVHALALGMLGRRDEALEHVSRMEASSHDLEPWRICARLRGLLLDPEGAIATGQRVVEASDDVWDRLRIARIRGRDALADLCTPEVLAQAGSNTKLASELARLLDEAGEHDRALRVIDASIESTEGEARAALARRAARLHLWRRDDEQARARLASLPEDDSQRLEMEGALAVLAGQPTEGLARLEAARARGGSREALLWQAHAHLALDQHELALAAIHEAILGENALPAFLLQTIALARTDPEALRRGASSPTFLEALIDDVLPSLVGHERTDSVRADPARLAELASELLEAMGGNRSARPTWCRVDDSGVRRLERIELPPTGREASVAALVRVRTDHPESVLAALAEVGRAHPRSPHPCTYAGELLLWLGRFTEALEAFDEADRRTPTRWSFVGRAAVHDLLGQPTEAERWSQEGVRRFGALASATTHVYRGERLRRAGELEAARADLELALHHRPRRLGARVNLALLLRTVGDEAGWSRELARLEAEAPAFLWEAGARPDRPIEPETLETTLRRMAGNRSSFLHTMIDDAGRFRVIPDPVGFRDHARLTLGLARRPLAIALRDAHLRTSSRLRKNA